MRRIALLVFALACGRAEIYGPRVFPAVKPDAGHAGGTGGGVIVPIGGGNGGGGGSQGGGLGGGGATCPPPTGTGCNATNPPQSFACIPGLRVIAHDTDLIGRDRYILGFRQPVDHDRPNGPTFEQRLWLFHDSSSKPMVFLATGYFLYDTRDELADRFDVNELSVEHRWFGDSYPDGGQLDFSHLDIRQASFDLHRIRVAFAGVYPKPWVSTGASKGGMTMVYYRRFFPCDVAGTVAYVAPHSESEFDPRYNAFLDAVGGMARADCRARLVNLQTQLLDRRAVIEPLFADAGTFTIAGSLDIAYETAVVSLNFAYWQYIDPNDAFSGCATLPTGTVPDADLQAWARAVFGADDQSLLPFAPYYWQAATELGDAKPYELPLVGHLAHAGACVPRTFIPHQLTVPAFDGGAMRDVQTWLSSNGEGIVFLYGELDPWTATQYLLGSSHDTIKVFAAGKNHLSTLRDLSSNDQEEAMQKVERWLGQRRTSLRAEPPSDFVSELPRLGGPPLPIRASLRRSSTARP